jgi:hypothetical protein
MSPELLCCRCRLPVPAAVVCCCCHHAAAIFTCTTYCRSQHASKRKKQSHPTSSHVLVMYHNSLCCRLLCTAADTMRCICLDSVTECVAVCRALLLQPCASMCLDYHCFTACRACCCQQSYSTTNSVLALCCLVCLLRLVCQNDS